MAESLLIKEIYFSIQGESSWAGLPCAFVRLTGCDLRCSYCDSVYAFRGGERMEVGAVIERIKELAGEPQGSAAGAPLPLVEITGGEPLLQTPVHRLMNELCDAGFKVLIETSGAHDIRSVHPEVSRILDLKCPASGESGRILWDNLEHLNSSDEVKFVITSHEDYVWAKGVLARYKLAERCPVLFSSVAALAPGQQSPVLKPVPSYHQPMTRQQLVEQIIQDRLSVRFQLQMHKFIWPPEQTGV